MNFIQRLTFLIHLTGFLVGVIALPIMVYFFFDGVDLDDGLLTSIILTILSPIIGWGLRWLIAGELSDFIPFQDNILKAIPRDGNYAIVLALSIVFSGLYFFSKEQTESKERWEQAVFGKTCKDKSGTPKVIDRYAVIDGEEVGRPIYCSDFLVPNARGKTLCTWDNATNADNMSCKMLAYSPSPTLKWNFIIGPPILIGIAVFYLLTLVTLIANLRNSSK